MPFSTFGKNAMLDHFASVALWASLHNNSPGDNGANEISGGTPAYIRKAVTWDPATGALVDANNEPVIFDVPATTVRHGGLWDAQVGGNFLGSDPVPEETFAGQGNYQLDSISGTIT